MATNAAEGPAQKLRQGLQKSLDVKGPGSQDDHSDKQAELVWMATADATTQTMFFEKKEQGTRQEPTEMERMREEMRGMEERARQREDKAWRMEEDIRRLVAQALSGGMQGAKDRMVDVGQTMGCQNNSETWSVTRVHRGEDSEKRTMQPETDQKRLAAVPHGWTAGGSLAGRRLERDFDSERSKETFELDGRQETQKVQEGRRWSGETQGREQQYSAAVIAHRALNVDLLSEIAIRDDSGIGNSVQSMASAHGFIDSSITAQMVREASKVNRSAEGDATSSTRSTRNYNTDAFVDESARTTPLNMQASAQRGMATSYPDLERIGDGRGDGGAGDGWKVSMRKDAREALAGDAVCRPEDRTLSSSLPSSTRLEDPALQSWTPASGESAQQSTSKTQSTDPERSGNQNSGVPADARDVQHSCKRTEELGNGEHEPGDKHETDTHNPGKDGWAPSAGKHEVVRNGHGGWLVEAREGRLLADEDKGMSAEGSEGRSGREVSIDVRRVLLLPSISSDRREERGWDCIESAPGEDDTTLGSSPSDWGESIQDVKGRTRIDGREEHCREQEIKMEEHAAPGSGPAVQTSSISPLSCSTMFSASPVLRSDRDACPSKHASIPVFNSTLFSPCRPDLDAPPNGGGTKGGYAEHQLRARSEKPCVENDDGHQREELPNHSLDNSAPPRIPVVVPKLDLKQLGKPLYPDEERTGSMAPRAVEPTDALRPPKRSISPQHYDGSVLSWASVSPHVQLGCNPEMSSVPQRRDVAEGLPDAAIVSAEGLPDAAITSPRMQQQTTAEQTNTSPGLQLFVGAMPQRWVPESILAEVDEDNGEGSRAAGESHAGEKHGRIIPKSGLQAGSYRDGDAAARMARKNLGGDGKSSEEGREHSDRTEKYRACEDPKQPNGVGVVKMPNSPASSERNNGLWSGSEFGNEMEDTCDSNSDSDHDGIVFSTRPVPLRGARFPPSRALPSENSSRLNSSKDAAHAGAPSLVRPSPFRAFPPLPPSLHPSSPRAGSTPPSHRRPPSSSTRARRGLFSSGAGPSPIPLHPPSHSSPTAYPPSSSWLADRSTVPGHDASSSAPYVPLHHLPLVGPGVPSLPTPRSGLRQRQGAELTASSMLSAQQDSVSPYAALDSLKQLAQQSVQTYRAAALRAYRAISPRTDDDASQSGIVVIE